MAKMGRKVIDTSDMEKQLRKLPQKVILMLMGLAQPNELHRFEQAWGCPVAKRTIDLFAVMGWLKGFFHKHAHILRQIIDASHTDPALAAQMLTAKVSIKTDEARRTKIRADKDEGKLLETKPMYDFLSRVAGHYRSAAEQAQRQWGKDGFEMFDRLRTDIEKDIAEMFPQYHLAQTHNIKITQLESGGATNLER